MSNKFYKLSRKERKLKQPLEIKFIKLSTLVLTTFLITFLSISILTPVQSSQAQEILLATQATGSAVSLTTSGDVNLSVAASPSAAVRTAVDAVRVTAGVSGYQLYISTSGDSNALVRDGATPTSTNPTAYATSDLIPAGGGTTLASPAVLANNTWGFAVTQPNANSGSGSEDVIANGFDASYPTGDDSVATSKFTQVPVKGNDFLIAKRSGVGSSILTNIYYGAKVTTAKPSGLYQATVVYTAIGNSSTSGLATVTPESTAQLAGGETLTISTPSTTALNSLGTITVTVGGATCVNPYASKNDAYVNVTCTSPALATGWHEVVVKFATSGETFVVNPGIEYYQDAAEIASTLQAFTSAECSALNLGQTITLQDSRDGKTYTVSKLPDNNCWLTQNLRLGDPGYDLTLTPADSDVTANFSLPASAVHTVASVWSPIDTTAAYTYLENSYVPAEYRVLFGNLYNWFTATAGTGTTSVVSTDASGSLCPKNWKLPPHTGDKSYLNLYQTPVSSGGLGLSTSSGTDAAFAAAVRQAPYSLAMSGIHYNGNGNPHVDVNINGGSGIYWERHVGSSSTMAYRFAVHSDGLVYNNSAERTNGYAVRCVFSG